MTRSIDIPDLAATEAFGRRLGGLLFPGAVVALVGPLGAGKTHLTRAVAEGLGVRNPAAVTSPTFVLIQEYPARLPVYHFDAYRLSGPREFAELGVEEYFAGDGVCLVEWADKVAVTLPADHLRITITVVDEHQRRFELVATGPRYEAVVRGMTGPGAPARQLVQRSQPGGHPLDRHPADQLVHRPVERGRGAGLLRQPQEVAGVVVEFRSPLLDLAGHRAVRPPQRRLEPPGHEPGQPLPPQDPGHRPRVERPDLAQLDAGRPEDGVVLLQQPEEQPTGGRHRQQLAVVQPGRRGQRRDGRVVHQLGVLERFDGTNLNHSKKVRWLA